MSKASWVGARWKDKSHCFLVHTNGTMVPRKTDTPHDYDIDQIKLNNLKKYFDTCQIIYKVPSFNRNLL